MKNESKHSVHWGHSLRKISWDESADKTKSQDLISATVHEWYDAKHRSPSNEEVELINSIEINNCRICGSTNIIRYGKKDGVNRYYCKDCHHTFGPLTGTIFSDRKIPISEWIEYLLHLFEFHSINTSSRDNRNASSTGKYWLLKVFEVLKHYQDNIILQDKVYLDETYFTVKKAQIKTHPDGKKYKGISRNKLCVGAAKDIHGRVVLIYESTSKPSLKSTWNSLGSHIKEGSLLLHDREKSHSVLVSKLNLTSEEYDAEVIKNLKDEDNPLDSINEIHYLAKRFMRAHGGYNRNNLQDYMNLLSFLLNEPYDRYEKVDLFINMALSAPIVVRYRDTMTGKTEKTAHITFK